MCKWGDIVHMHVMIPEGLSHTGKAYKKPVGIDRCIAPIVKALNDRGIPTIASCCGHGERPGSIILNDGRELVICPDFDTARVVDKAFPTIFEEEKKDVSTL